jgi:hypothetical protein
VIALALIAALLAPDAGLVADAAVDAAPVLEPSGPPPVAKMSCAPQPVQVGDPLTCTVTIAHRKDVSVKVVAPTGATRQDAAPAEPLPNGDLRSTRVIVLRPMGLRDVRIKGFAVIWQEASGYEGTVDIPGQRVPVKSMLVGQAEPKFRTFTEPQVEVPVFHERHGGLAYIIRNWPLIIGLIILGAIIIGVGVGFLVKRWLAGRVVDEGPFVDPRPAHVIAYEQLERLVAEDLPHQGELKAFYFRLSEVVRDYIGHRFQFDALEMTSHEIRTHLHALEADQPSVEGDVAMRAFLDETDLVKFADFAPPDEGGDTVLRMARGLIELTRQADDAPDAEEGAA